MKGIRHGIFEHFDTKGRKIGIYRFSNGNGTVMIYHSNGRLHRFADYENNKMDGRDFEFHENGSPWSLAMRNHGKFVGTALSFSPDGWLRSVVPFDSKGRPHGAALFFNDGEDRIAIAIYKQNGRKMDKKSYEALAAAGDVPALVGDIKQLSKLKDALFGDSLAHLKELLRQEIPLDSIE